MNTFGVKELKEFQKETVDLMERTFIHIKLKFEEFHFRKR